MTRTTAPPPHVQHVHEHMERLASGITITTDPEKVFLGPEEENQFWEVVGFRLRGVPTLVLGAVRFHRHDMPGRDYARESLAAYLSTPPAPLVTSMDAARAGEVSAYLPRWNETVPNFLARLRGGPDTAPVHLLPELVQVAFDLRTENPSGFDSMKRRAGPLAPHVVRTADGHVLYGLARRMRADEGRFLALTRAQQYTPKGRISLPALMLNRAYVTAIVPLAHERTRLAAANWAPFMPATANPEHILHL